MVQKSTNPPSQNHHIMTNSPESVIRALGSVTWLYQYSDIHKSYPVGLLLSRTLPPMELDQFRLFFNNKNLPIGFCAWARLSQDSYDAVIKNKGHLRPEDWKSGNIPFITELVAPFGHMLKIAKKLREEVFKGELVTSLKTSNSLCDNKTKENFRIQKFQC